MQRSIAFLISAALLLPGCYEEDRVVVPQDVTAPAAPRGLYSVTGDGQVWLYWLSNTESDVAGYNVYLAPCASGGGCPYERVGSTTGTTFSPVGLTNGVTRFYAVAAVDRAGNESDLSYEDVFDTPRPEGFGVVLQPFQNQPALSGWDFSSFSVVPWDATVTDVFFSWNGSFNEMLTPDPATGIQDMGFASTLDAVDYAPPTGWSPTGSVELIVGHNYVVRTRDGHYAKIRVTGLGGSLVFDWAYQVAPGNRELRAAPAAGPATGAPAPAPANAATTANSARIPG